MIKMTRTIRVENNTLIIKHNFIIGIIHYVYEYEDWLLKHFDLKIKGSIDYNSHEVRFVIDESIGVKTVATAFKLEYC